MDEHNKEPGALGMTFYVLIKSADNTIINGTGREKDITSFFFIN